MYIAEITFDRNVLLCEKLCKNFKSSRTLIHLFQYKGHQSYMKFIYSR